MPRLLPLITILVGITSASVLANYSDGVAAYQQGDYELALQHWMKVIQSPSETVHPAEMAETSYAVAMLYWMGQGVQQDTATAAAFLRQAAELNHAGAQSKLGYLFLIGQGVPQSYPEALKWLEMAALQGDADAQYNIGVIYRDGLGVDVNVNRALRWFREAAANGDPYSAAVVAAYEKQGVLEQANTPLPEPDADVVDAESSSEEMENVADPGSFTAQADPILEQGTLPDGEASNRPEAFSFLDSEQWILARDPGHFTIQVMALKNRENLDRLIAQHPAMAPMAVYRQGDPAAPLYVLVQGDFPDAGQAKSAAAAFPRSLANPKQLWVRRYEMVQSLVNEFGNNGAN